ncbi:hypothetical Protein YC6258_01317 [Gynuella sunshinyii YC6258]|uniref:Uncharacterized protein n=1 Tax=Gynuella sunshinyii YC6258 TaxID=1445510 RepID=A0A0C5V1F7_9GAMM|nr:hypothetical Protein YC6258_01317 [Gynuella sunshinyii YC6258]
MTNVLELNLSIKSMQLSENPGALRRIYLNHLVNVRLSIA